MRGRAYYQPDGTSANAAEYQRVFLAQAHRLLAMGYGELIPDEHSHAEEEDITGRLVQAMEAVLDRPGAPPWMTWLDVQEDPRIHDPQRKGKRRRRVDIRIVSAQRRPRSRLSFEAKRLGRGHGVSVYLGKDGLGCFIDGRYARRENVAGMLGYVQKGSCEDWVRRIAKAIAQRAGKLHMLKSSLWERARVVRELGHTYRSGHARPGIGRSVQVYHTLLLFN